MLENATELSFNRDVLESELPVLVDFWAEWCQPCKAMMPVLEAIAEKYQGRVRVVKVDVDANPLLLRQYSIRSLPTLMVFEAGQMKAMRSGAISAAGIDALLA